MELLRKKLKSKRGASIIMALFLFLICAVIGSLVLTAATAAAGRRATAEQTDQRYYSVDSAAGAVRELVTGGSITVLRTKTQVTEVTDSLVKDDAGAVTWIDSDSDTKEPTYSLSFPGFASDTDRERDLLVFAAESLIPGYDGSDGGKYGYDSAIPSGFGSEKSFSVSTPSGLLPDTDTSFLNIGVKMTVSDNGDLIFTFSSGDARPYVLKEVFSLSYSESTSVNTTPGEHRLEETGENEYTDTYSVTTTETKKGIFQWEFVSCSVE